MTDHACSSEGSRRIRRVAAAPREPAVPGLLLARLHPEQIDGGMGPFLQIDAFSLAEPVFAPHPHAGFSAVTYLFEASPAGFINRDTLGNKQRIAPGALHWTAAGRGVMHEEVPERRGTPAIGLQMFIDLPADAKQMPPLALHLEPLEIPVWQAEGVRTRIVVGCCNGVRSPLPTLTPGVLLLDVMLQPGAEFVFEPRPEDDIFLWIRDGSLQAPACAPDRALDTFDFAGLDRATGRVCLRAGNVPCSVVVGGGPPLKQPVVARGPFVMDSAPALQEAIARYAAGAMGKLEKSDYDEMGRPSAPPGGTVIVHF